MAMFYVYAAKGRKRDFRWELASEHESIGDAEIAAKSLCPKGEIYTEPGHGLPRAFFGSRAGERWSAMISSKREAA